MPRRVRFSIRFARRTRRATAPLLLSSALLLGGSLAVAGGPTPALAAPASPASSLSLSPKAGPPGTIVTLRGDVPGMDKAPPSYQGVTVCLGSCASGFTEQSVPIRFLGHGRFSARFTLPTAPVLTAKGPLSLTNGSYRIGYTCIGPQQQGCLGSTEASARFTVTGSAEKTCSVANPCAALRFTPAVAAPGQEVRFSGYAPIAPAIGQPFGYTLAFSLPGHSPIQDSVAAVQETFAGRISGTFRMPAVLPGLGLIRPGTEHLALQYQFQALPTGKMKLPPGVTVTQHSKEGFGFETFTLASTPFTVRALPTWKSLGTLTPVPGATQWSQPLPLSTRGASTKDFAYCVPGGIRLTQNGGRTFQRVDTSGAALASKGGPFPLFANLSVAHPSATCTRVLWDPNDPHTFYATFNAENRIYHSAPPVYTVAYETQNGGATWAPVPVPKGDTEGDFGGMSLVRVGHQDAVAMVFGRTAPNTPAVGTVTATEEVSRDGGRSFSVTELSCPAAGPCVRFGPMPGAQPGMGTADVQPLLWSTDGGHHWTALTWPSGNLEAQDMLPTGQSELVGLGGNRVAFLDPNSQYALRISQNGGTTWQAIALPVPPGQETRIAQDGALPYQALMWLPNGDLLAAMTPTGGSLTTTAQWYVLAPGAAAWTRDRALTMPDVLGRLVIAGTSLYGLGLNVNGGLVYTRILKAPLP